MYGSFWDALSPENVVENAVHGLFDGPLPVVTRADMDARRAGLAKKESAQPVNESKNVASEITEAEKQVKKIQLRRLISLNEAITLGTFNAVEDETRGKVIEFEDFETTQELRLAPFYASFDEVNSHIYTTITQIKKKTPTNPLTNSINVRDKILTNPEVSLTEDEYLAYQSLRVVGFLTNEDLFQFRIKMYERSLDEATLPQDDEKQNIYLQADKNVADAFLSRVAYISAFGSHNIVALNLEKGKSHYPHSISSQSLKEEITELRQQARNARESIHAMQQFDTRCLRVIYT